MMAEKPNKHEAAIRAMQAIITHDGFADERKETIAKQAYDMAEALVAEAEARVHQRSDDFY